MKACVKLRAAGDDCYGPAERNPRPQARGIKRARKGARCPITISSARDPVAKARHKGHRIRTSTTQIGIRKPISRFRCQNSMTNSVSLKETSCAPSRPNGELEPESPHRTGQDGRTSERPRDPGEKNPAHARLGNPPIPVLHFNTNLMNELAISCPEFRPDRGLEFVLRIHVPRTINRPAISASANLLQILWKSRDEAVRFRRL